MAAGEANGEVDGDPDEEAKLENPPVLLDSLAGVPNEKDGFSCDALKVDFEPNAEA